MVQCEYYEIVNFGDMPEGSLGYSVYSYAG